MLSATVTGGEWEYRGVWIADYIAEWVYAHPAATLHGTLAAVLFSFLYSLVSSFCWGQTLGRRVVNTELVSDDGGRPRFIKLALRSSLSIVSFFAFGAGHFWSIIDRERRTWHDRLSHTIVVDRCGLKGGASGYSAVVLRNEKT